MGFIDNISAELARLRRENDALRADLASIRSVYDFAALEAKIAELRTALKPFADAAEVFNTWCDGSTYPLAIEHAEGNAGLITLGDFRRAAQALEQNERIKSPG